MNKQEKKEEKEGITKKALTQKFTDPRFSKTNTEQKIKNQQIVLLVIN